MLMIKGPTISNKLSKDQKGFSVVEGLLILVIIGLLGFVGWYVWNAQHKTSDILDTANTSGTSSVAKSTNPPKSIKYLEIKELGIKFELSDKIKDAYYYVSKQGFVYLSVHRFDNLKGFEDCTAKGYSYGAKNDSDSDGSGLATVLVGEVGKENGTPSGELWTQAALDKSDMTKVGDKYYGLQGRYQSSCYDTSTVPESDPNAVLVGELKKAIMGQQATIIKL